MADQELPKKYLNPDEKTSDADLITIANAWLEESKKYHAKLEKIWKQNEEYYKGQQTFMERVPSDMSNAVQNQIFMGVETVVPIATANPPQFVVEPPEESDQSGERSESVQKVLSVEYDNLGTRFKGETLIRHMLIYRFGAWKVFWDEDRNDIGLKNIRPKRLFFPEVATELPYIMEQQDITSQEFRDTFGDYTFTKFLENKGQEFDPNLLNQVSGIYTIWEIWTPRLVFWKHGSFLIDKRKNPYYDFKKPERNHFASPQIPYVIASAFRLGNEPVGETDLIQQTIPIQDVVNVANRLIINNANKMGNAQWYVDPEVMTEEEARQKLTNSPGLVIWGSGVANENLMRRDPPPPLPAYIPQLKQMAENSFDNIFGTHSTTRGERDAPETLGGRMLLKQADIGRIDLLVREYERCVTELGNWGAQLLRLFFSGRRAFRYYGEKGMEFISFEADMIEKGIRVLIKAGTTMPVDDLAKRREALELWAQQAISPQTLYERLKFPDPEGEAKKLAAWIRERRVLEGEGEEGASPAQGRGITSPTRPTAQGREVKPLARPATELEEAEKRQTGGT